ncbi:MAG: VWA domain-containing protein [Planctomycetes bacterium]|nr:VWA domain-containing protein [Planctomycetota bacterium]
MPASILPRATTALLLVLSLSAQDEAKPLAAFAKAFAAAAKGKAPPPAAERQAALDGTKGIDSPRATEVFVAGWLDLDADIATNDAQRTAVNEEIAKLIKGQESAPTRTLPKDALDRLKEVQKESAELGDRIADLRKLQSAVGDRIAVAARRDSLLWLLQRVCSQKRPAPLKLAAARALGAGAVDVMDELVATLSRTKDPTDQIVLLDAFAGAGHAAQAFATPVLALLQSPEDAVAERAALALAKIATPEAIAPMITLLERATGQMKMRVASALEVLTSQQFGSNVGSWQAWWKAEGAGFVAGGKPLGGGTPSHRKDTDKFYYFGIPQGDSSSILYVIDCSGSMKEKVKVETGAAKTEGGAETSRLEACKAELSKALGLLRPEQKFAILWYNDQPHWWEKKLQPAAKDVVVRAQAFVKGLSPSSSTNIHDSMQQGFSLVGRGAKDKYYGLELDTIFLLTDGSPTKPDGQLDSTDKILIAVREWNALKRVTIHCIAIGKDLNAEFLRRLADENGGEFKQY